MERNSRSEEGKERVKEQTNRREERKTREERDEE
jgi:hypothetical protein